MSRRFTRKGKTLIVSLSAPERELLSGWVPDQLRTVYESEDSENEAKRRLFPVAYLDPTEEEAEGEWQELVHPELRRTRLDALTRLTAALDAAEPGRRGAFLVELASDDVAALLGVLNDARLALGTVLEVSEDTDLADLDAGDAATQGHMIYVWLTHLEGELVDTLLDDMPE